MFPIIFKKDSTGKIRTWQAEVDGDSYRTIAGTQDGKKVTSNWTICYPKNTGKKNETNAEEQALKEAQAEMDLKLERDYRRTIEELDSVPPSPMLARKYEDEKDKLKFPVYSQPKLDGIRATISRFGAFSRDYQRHCNVQHILDAFNDVFIKWPDLVFDGEFYNHDLKDDFNTITSLVRREAKNDEERSLARANIQYHVYDIVSDKPFKERIFLIGDVFNYIHEVVGDVLIPSLPLRMVQTLDAHNHNELDIHYEFLLNDGYEGQMVRVNGPYESDKRSKQLLKRKEFITEEFKLMEVNEGQGNWSGYAKRVVFQLADRRPCGAGIRGTREQMKKILDEFPQWDLQNAQVTVRYFTPTPDGMPRFPVVIDFHPHGRKD